MVRNDLFIKVPSFFKCPISLDVMKSPVSLCTGVTYDRACIQKWLDSGNNTCPATMQVLQSKEIIPNHTLQRLIGIWSESVKDSDHPATATTTTAQPPLSSDEAKTIIDDLKNSANPTNSSPDSITKLGRFSQESEKNKEFLINAGCIPVLAGILKEQREIRVYEEAVKILLSLILLSKDPISKKRLVDRSILGSFSLVLLKGSLESKIDCAKLIETIAIDSESKEQISEKGDLLDLLMKFACLESNPRAIETGLSCLILLTANRRVRSELVRFGIVSMLRKLFDSCDEKAMKLLEMVSSCKEGRSAICEDPAMIPAIVRKISKVSNKVTEHAVVILWSVCHVFPDQRAQEGVVRSNGLTKILLLMQSNCSPAVREMAGDLLKIFRRHGVCSKSKNCISSYDSKTTHIMPF